MKLKVLYLLVILSFSFSTVMNAQKNKSTSKSKSGLNLTWTSLGPNNLSGRTRAILVDKNTASIMYVGSTSGGLWKSSTGGSSWNPINDLADNLCVSSIGQAIDGSIYVGTGDGLSLCNGTANGSTAFIGKGIYKSTDGSTFTLLNSTIPSVSNNDTVAWVFVNKIACDPTNANRIYAATNKGLRRSDDGGLTWSNPIKDITGAVINQNSTDVEVSLDGTVVAAVGCECYISDNGNDNTFTCQSSNSSTKLPLNMGRLELAISPSNSSYIYAITISSTGIFYNIYTSSDKGNTWSVIGQGGSSYFQPCTNGLTNCFIKVNPTTPTSIYVGGDNLWKWELGSTWTQITMNGLDPMSTTFLHSGQNTLVFGNSNANTMYIGSNGGISRTYDGGKTFQTLNINYNTSECYSVSFSPNGQKIMAGTQDNGTLLIDRTYAFPTNANPIKTGNGGWSAFSYIDTLAYFANSTYGLTGRSPDGGTTFYNGNDASSPFFSLRLANLNPGASGFSAYITPILMWESFNDSYSTDSITFTPKPVKDENMGKGKAGKLIYDTIVSRGGQSSASIIPGTFELTSGTLHVTDDKNGKLIGSVHDSIGFDSINYQTGHYKLQFSSVPSLSANILASYEIKFDANSVINVSSENQPGTFDYTTQNEIGYGDTIKVQDIIQSKFYLGTSTGIWMTKEALKFSVRPHWYKIAVAGLTQCMALSHDGNYLFAGTSDGLIYRVSNLREAQDSISSDLGSTSSVNPFTVIETKKINFPAGTNRAITSISVDPNNANNVVVTLGNYKDTNYVYYCSNALDSIPVFVCKQGNLPSMPVYSSCIPLLSNGTVIIGTEHGVYSTDITSSSPTWSEENSGLANVPVYMISQQQYTFSGVSSNNYGSIYAATHGRGIFECNKYLSVNNYNAPSNNAAGSIIKINVFPNPVVDNASIAFTLPKSGSVKVNVYDVKGKLIISNRLNSLEAGNHVYSLPFNDVQQGIYFIRISSGSMQASAKLIKM